jgi:cell division protein FtsB
VVLVALFVLGVLGAFIGEGGASEKRHLRGEVAALRGEVASAEAEVGRLRADIERLESDPGARERLAREQLGLVRPGEVDFLLPRARTGGSP